MTDAASPESAPRRDSVHTRQSLVRAARHRFAAQGYRATTVRDIAADAGVNVALISRYFGSKDGLFEACLNRTVEELDPGIPAPKADVRRAIASLIEHVATSPDVDEPLQLLLLLRSSGDEQADAVRRRTLATFSRRLAASAGWKSDDADEDDLLLRAQVAIATLVGMVMLRTSTGLEPVTSADVERLTGPLTDTFSALLCTPSRGSREG